MIADTHNKLNELFLPMKRISSFRTQILTSVVFILFVVMNIEVDCQSKPPQTLLADGTPYLTWSDVTKYTRTYHVDQTHPGASDKNDGTRELPCRQQSF